MKSGKNENGFHRALDIHHILVSRSILCEVTAWLHETAAFFNRFWLAQFNFITPLLSKDRPFTHLTREEGTLHIGDIFSYLINSLVLSHQFIQIMGTVAPHSEGKWHRLFIATVTNRESNGNWYGEELLTGTKSWHPRWNLIIWLSPLGEIWGKKEQPAYLMSLNFFLTHKWSGTRK